jgi:hypothetical protein
LVGFSATEVKDKLKRGDKRWRDWHAAINGLAALLEALDHDGALGAVDILVTALTQLGLLKAA